MYEFLSRWSDRLARWVALIGGGVLLLVVALNCISIIGRAFVPLDIGIGPIKGIYDITEIGMAAAIFAFLPLCHLQRGHAKVDLLRPLYSPRFNRLLDLVFDTAMLVVAAVIAWRLYFGFLDKLRYGETTLIAQIPVWQGYLGGLAGACVFVLVAAFCVLRSGRAMMGGARDKGAHV